MGNEFVIHTQQEHAQSIANLLPGGKIFPAKNISETNLRKLLLGLALESRRTEGKIVDVSIDYNINETEQLIDEWESAVGIPDQCFEVASTIEDRRRNVLIKLAKMNISTKEDFIALAALFGIKITIRTGLEAASFPYTFPIIFFNNQKEARFTMIIDFPKSALGSGQFPYTFPITFGRGETNILQCLFSRLRPANVKIIYNYVDD